MARCADKAMGDVCCGGCDALLSVWSLIGSLCQSGALMKRKEVRCVFVLCRPARLPVRDQKIDAQRTGDFRRPRLRFEDMSTTTTMSREAYLSRLYSFRTASLQKKFLLICADIEEDCTRLWTSMIIATHSICTSFITTCAVSVLDSYSL
jgi:hypothetical protein